MLQSQSVRLSLACSALLVLASGAASAQTPDPAPASAATSAIGPVAHHGGPFENLSLFAGLDGSKQPQDLGINANMGARFAANLGMPLIPKYDVGMQVGAAVNLSDSAVHVLDQIEGTSRRTQTYVTVGAFQRQGVINWSLGYDALIQEYYDNFNLGQMRGSAGVDVTAHDEVGAWFTKSVKSEQGVMGGTPVYLSPVSQANGYLRHLWPSGAHTSMWVGVAAGHNDIVWVLPANPRDRHVIVYGANLQMPLSDRFAVTGAANFLTPTATGTVDAYLGLTFYPGRNAFSRNQGRFAPSMNVANNPEFPVNMTR